MLFVGARERLPQPHAHPHRRRCSSPAAGGRALFGVDRGRGDVVTCSASPGSASSSSIVLADTRRRCCGISAAWGVARCRPAPRSPACMSAARDRQRPRGDALAADLVGSHEETSRDAPPPHLRRAPPDRHADRDRDDRRLGPRDLDEGIPLTIVAQRVFAGVQSFPLLADAAVHARRLAHERIRHQRAPVRLHEGARRPHPRRPRPDRDRRQRLPFRHLRVVGRRLRGDDARARAAARRERLQPRLRRGARRFRRHARADHPALDPDGALRLAGERVARRPLRRRPPAGPRHGRRHDARHRRHGAAARATRPPARSRLAAVAGVQARLLGPDDAGDHHRRLPDGRLHRDGDRRRRRRSIPLVVGIFVYRTLPLATDPDDPARHRPRDGGHPDDRRRRRARSAGFSASSRRRRSSSSRAAHRDRALDGAPRPERRAARRRHVHGDDRDHDHPGADPDPAARLASDRPRPFRHRAARQPRARPARRRRSACCCS